MNTPLSSIDSGTFDPQSEENFYSSTSSTSPMSSTASLVWLGRWLASQRYRFTTVTPATHALVNSRPQNVVARSIADVFGWSRPFRSELMPLDVFEHLHDAGLIVALSDAEALVDAPLFKTTVRCSSLGDRLFLHSAFPTTNADSVFFGPDTYRFASLIEREIGNRNWPAGARVLDVGCGAGPGGVRAVDSMRDMNPSLVLSDINNKALDFARANAALAGLGNVHCARSDLFGDLQGSFDLIVANPPYLVDAASRVYRDGGGVMGTGLGVRIVREGLTRLRPGGALVLYTGVPIAEGRDQFHEEVAAIADTRNVRLAYKEVDPDVFGEELASPAYASVDRLAIVAAVFEL